MTEMLDKMDFVIMPVLNVDGYAYTWQSVCIHYYKLVYFLILSRLLGCRRSFKFFRSIHDFYKSQKYGQVGRCNQIRSSCVQILNFALFCEGSNQRCLVKIEQACAFVLECTRCLLFPN